MKLSEILMCAFLGCVVGAFLTQLITLRVYPPANIVSTREYKKADGGSVYEITAESHVPRLVSLSGLSVGGLLGAAIPIIWRSRRRKQRGR